MVLSGSRVQQGRGMQAGNGLRYLTVGQGWRGEGRAAGRAAGRVARCRPCREQACDFLSECKEAVNHLSKVGWAGALRLGS